MTDKSNIENFRWKAPDYFSRPVHEQIAIQVARTISDCPEQRNMMIYTYDKTRINHLQKFVFSLDDI